MALHGRTGIAKKKLRMMLKCNKTLYVNICNISLYIIEHHLFLTRKGQFGILVH